MKFRKNMGFLSFFALALLLTVSMTSCEFTLSLSDSGTVTPSDGTESITGSVVIEGENNKRQIGATQDSLEITLSYDDSDDMTIRYTTDGTDVNYESTEYTEPFSIDEDTTITAAAYDDSGDYCTQTSVDFYKVTDEYSTVADLQDAIVELMSDDEYGTDGDYNHIAPSSSLTDLSYLFSIDDLESFNGDISAWDVSSVENMEYMFKSTESFNQSLNDWDVSSVENMDHMFKSAESFNQSLNDWDVSSVSNMNSMFQSASVFDGDISEWDVSSVTDMSSMFYNASVFNADISGWDVSNVIDMSSMFYEAVSFAADLSDWTVSSVTNMSEMFAYASDFDSNLDSWNVSSVTDMSFMFEYAYSFNVNLNSWNVENVTSMYNMFAHVSNYESDLSSWNVSSVTNISYMFDSTSNTSTVDLSSWDVSSVTDMSYMFFNSDFDCDISDWKLSSLETCSWMLGYTSEFYQDLTDWNDDLPDGYISYNSIISNSTNMTSSLLPEKLGGDTTTY